MPRYHIAVWQEDGKFCCTDILPDPVSLTILSALEHGLRHGTVIHNRTIHGVDGVYPELYCWQVR